MKGQEVQRELFLDCLTLPSAVGRNGESLRGLKLGVDGHSRFEEAELSQRLIPKKGYSSLKGSSLGMGIQTFCERTLAKNSRIRHWLSGRKRKECKTSSHRLLTPGHKRLWKERTKHTVDLEGSSRSSEKTVDRNIN